MPNCERCCKPFRDFYGLNRHKSRKLQCRTNLGYLCHPGNGKIPTISLQNDTSTAVNESLGAVNESFPAVNESFPAVNESLGVVNESLWTANESSLTSSLKLTIQEEEEDKTTCKYCLKEFQPKNLFNHILVCKLKDNPIRLLEIDLNIKKEKSLSTKCTKLTCNYCDNVFSYQCNVNRHLKICKIKDEYYHSLMSLKETKQKTEIINQNNNNNNNNINSNNNTTNTNSNNVINANITNIDNSINNNNNNNNNNMSLMLSNTEINYQLQTQVSIFMKTLNNVYKLVEKNTEKNQSEVMNYEHIAALSKEDIIIESQKPDGCIKIVTKDRTPDCNYLLNSQVVGTADYKRGIDMLYKNIESKMPDTIRQIEADRVTTEDEGIVLEKMREPARSHKCYNESRRNLKKLLNEKNIQVSI